MERLHPPRPGGGGGAGIFGFLLSRQCVEMGTRVALAALLSCSDLEANPELIT